MRPFSPRLLLIAVLVAVVAFLAGRAVAQARRPRPLASVPRLGTALAARGAAVLTLPDRQQVRPGAVPCLPANPSCQHDAWWVEWFNLDPPTATTVVTFEPLGSGIRAQERLAEAVAWVWLSPVGHDLLTALAPFDLTLIVAPQSVVGPDGVVAHYDPSAHTIRVSDRYANVSSWVLGDVMTHELTHAHQDQLHQLGSGGTAACLAAELPARENELAYTRWVDHQFGGLPTPQQVGQTLSAEDNALYGMVVAVARGDDLLPIVDAECHAVPGQ